MYGYDVNKKEIFSQDNLSLFFPDVVDKELRIDAAIQINDYYYIFDNEM